MSIVTTWPDANLFELPPLSPQFYAYAPPAATVPIYHVLEQALSYAILHTQWFGHIEQVRISDSLIFYLIQSETKEYNIQRVLKDVRTGSDISTQQAQ